jgi:hypothetical protein
MAPGELLLEVLSSGVFTQKEIDWVLAERGRLLDQAGIRLGCRS